MQFLCVGVVMSLRFKRVVPASYRAASDRDRALNRATEGDTRSLDDQSPLSLSNGTSNAVNLIAAAVAANVAFDFSSPVSAQEAAEAHTESRGDNDSQEAGANHAANEAAEHAAQEADNDGASGKDAHDENKSDDDSLGDGTENSASAQSAQPQQAEKQDANAKHHNSSTAPGLMGAHQNEGGTGARSSASSESESSNSNDAAGKTFVFAGVGSNGEIASFIGTAESAGTTTVDFSQVNPAATSADAVHKVVAQHVTTDAGTGHTGAPAGTTLHTASEAKAGVLVDLSAHTETAQTEHGSATVQAWSLGADGKTDAALAHIENVDNVIGTVADDIISGNAHANTITYTASDDAQHATPGCDGTGAQSSYGFDIISGGPSPFSHSHEAAGDVHDTADFSRVGSAEGVGEAAAQGIAAEILSDHATGIAVDLQVAVTIDATNPHSGATVEVTGSVVSANGGSVPVDLALLTWAPQSNSGHHGGAPASTIENIVGSQGADHVAGDAKDNTYFAVGDGTSGASLFDGRAGSDTIVFSKLLSGITGIDLHLGDATPGGGSGSSVATVASGSDAGTAIIALSNVENVVGSRGNDTIQGNSADNILTGIGGNDTFIFKSTIFVNGLEYANIGNDVITDFHGGSGSSGHGSGHDSLWLNSNFFHFDSGWSASDKLQKLFDAFAHDDNGSMVIKIDDNNSIRLDHVSLNEARFYFSDTFYFI